jgi:hypothetical protein
VGGVPTPSVDDPVSSVLAFLFLIATAAHMAVFQINKRRDHLFIFSAMMFAFSLIRAVALILRIAWASYPGNVRLAIAANILAQAGTILVFLINLFFAQRILRGYNPNFGWSKPARILFRFLFASVVISLIMVIATTVQSFFTLNQAARDTAHKVQLFGGTYLAVLAFLPIPIVVLAVVVPRKYVIEKFGSGSWRAKLFLLLFTASLMTLGAGFRAGTNYAPRPVNDPAWYHSRGPYYAFNYVLDLVVTYLYLLVGFDKRFHIPNGANGPGSYMGTLPTERVLKAERTSQSTPPTSFQSSETLSMQSGSVPTPKVHNSKMPVHYVGYNDSVSSLKKTQQRKQRNRLSKTNSRQFRRSIASIGSIDTYIGSTAPSVSETIAPSMSSLHRGASGPVMRHPDLPLGATDAAMLPPVPVLPAHAEGIHGASRERTIYEEPDSGALRSGVEMESPKGTVGRVKQPGDVVHEMLDKMDSLRGSAESHRSGHKRSSTERTSGSSQMRGSREFEMSGAGGRGRRKSDPEGEEKKRRSGSSSQYNAEVDGADSEKQNAWLRRS